MCPFLVDRRDADLGQETTKRGQGRGKLDAKFENIWVCQLLNGKVPPLESQEEWIALGNPPHGYSALVVKMEPLMEVPLAESVMRRLMMDTE